MSWFGFFKHRSLFAPFVIFSLLSCDLVMNLSSPLIFSVLLRCGAVVKVKGNFFWLCRVKKMHEVSEWDADGES
jgi:hypothetical protein